MSNQINELSPNIRDFLLNRNLILSDTVTNNGLSNIASGLGLQATIDDNINSIQPSQDIEDSSIEFRNSLVSRNQYTSIEDMVQATIINNSFSYNQVNGGYLEENGQLNLGGPSTNALDIITSITSQEGFSLGEGGFIPNNNINTSITGRVLGGVGAINDTPLGIIGGQQLLLALKQKIAFNTQKELLGKVNLQPFSLLRGASFLNPDYSITVSSSTGGRIFDTALDLSGFELPLSKMDAGTSIFENDGLFEPDSIVRNNAMIRNTGKGQILRLFEVLNQNKYKPEYESDRNDDRLGISNPLEYGPVTSGVSLGIIGVTNPINNPSPLSIDKIEFDGTDTIWQPNVIMDEQDSLLYKTRKLFDDRLNYLINFDLQGTPKSDFTQLATSSGGRYSKGSGVRSEDNLFNGDNDNVFCRTWNSIKSYDNIGALQKNSGLKVSPNRFRRSTDKSVLDDNGFVKITPYNNPNNNRADAKKFMFSIENLAWNDKKEELPQFEIGPGDPISGTKGRIMWFPPYDINFSENTTVNWDTTNFIGRGEPIYTYNNTERSGELSWKIIIDHPDYFNDKQNLTSDDIIASIVAGCTDYDRFFSQDELTQIKNEINENISAGNEAISNAEGGPDDINFYFPNDVATLSDVYEIPNESYGLIPSEGGYNSTEGTLYDNGPNSGLNARWNDNSIISDIKEFLTANRSYKLVINSYASKPGTSTGNQRLSDARLENVRRWLLENIGLNLTIDKAISNGSSQSSSGQNDSPDSKSTKTERRVRVQFVYDASINPQIIEQAEVKKDTNTASKSFVDKVKRRFFNESEYFDRLEKSDNVNDKIVYNTIRDKIKFFQPAFHSTTPEGFNSRLTFLQQCTRQGPTDSEIKAKNLAFGSPPVCILRIGDFYNTKIIINSLSFTFDPLVWDLNPEGVGVQPMIANVKISFKFIGGSSLTGPIKNLQNAVSFNYFANTEVYDPRADTIIAQDGEFKTSGGSENLNGYLGEDFYQVKSSKESNIPSAKDQGAVSELVANESTIGLPTSGNDKTEISSIKLISYENLIDINGNYSIDLNFTYIPTVSSTYSLNNSFNGNIILTSNENPSLMVNLGYIKVTPNTQNDFIVSDKVNNQSQTISSGNLNSTINLSNFTSEVVSKVQGVISTGGGILKLQWPTGSRSNINFN